MCGGTVTALLKPLTTAGHDLTAERNRKHVVSPQGRVAKRHSRVS